MEPKSEVMSPTSSPQTPFEEPEMELALSDQATPDLVLSGEATADVTASDQPTVDIAATDQPTADIAASDQQTAEIAASDQPTADIAASGQPTADIAASDQPTADIATSDKPTADIAAPDQPAAEVASTKVILTNEASVGHGGAYSEGAYSEGNVLPEPPRSSFRESNLMNVQAPSMWSHTEVRLLLEAHAELDAEFHAIPGTRGTSYHKQLLHLLLQRDPEFRHSADAIKAKINRLKSNYENLRDRLEWADRLEQSEPSPTAEDFAARLRAADIPDRLPEWFVLMDPIMTRQQDRRWARVGNVSRDSRGRWRETRFDSPVEDRQRSSALLLGIARAITAGGAAAAAGGQKVEAAEMKAGTSDGATAAAGTAAAGTYAAALLKGRAAGAGAVAPAAGAGQSNPPQSNRSLLPLLRSAAPPSRAPRGKLLSSSPHPPSARSARLRTGPDRPDRYGRSDRLERFDKRGRRGRADEMGADGLDEQDGGDGVDEADGWVGRRRKRGSTWREREMLPRSRVEQYESAFPAFSTGRDTFSGGEAGDVMVERACADFEDGMQEWAESLCCQFEDSMMEFAEAACFQFKSLTREFRDSWTAGRGAKRYQK